MNIEDDWTGVNDRTGHTPGAWDCPCGPWVRTDMDVPPTGLRTVRHVAHHSRAICMPPPDPKVDRSWYTDPWG